MNIASAILSFLLIGVYASFGQPTPDLNSINLLDKNGKAGKITLAPEKHLIILMLGTDCPITQKYVPTIERLKQEFGAKAEFVGVFTKQTSVAEMNAFLEEYKFSLPCYIDNRSELTTALNASVTPEAFLFDQRLTHLYSGAIDNWFYKLGSYRAKPTQHYLKDALRCSLAEKPITTKRTEPIGCLISKPKKSHEHH